MAKAKKAKGVKKYHFVVVSCMGAVGQVIRVWSAQGAGAAESKAFEYMDEHFDCSTCEQCFSSGWTLMGTKNVTIEPDDWRRAVELTVEETVAKEVAQT